MSLLLHVIIAPTVSDVDNNDNDDDNGDDDAVGGYDDPNGQQTHAYVTVLIETSSKIQFIIK